MMVLSHAPHFPAPRPPLARFADDNFDYAGLRAGYRLPATPRLLGRADGHYRYPEQRRWVFEGSIRPPGWLDLRRAGRHPCGGPASAHTPIAVGLVLVGAMTPLALLTVYAPNYRIAPVTAIIVLMSSGSATLGPLAYALDRVLEITLGSVVAVAVSVLIAPTRAYWPASRGGVRNRAASSPNLAGVGASRPHRCAGSRQAADERASRTQPSWHRGRRSRA